MCIRDRSTTITTCSYAALNKQPGLQEWREALVQPIEMRRVQRLLQAAQAAQDQAQGQVLDLTFRQVDSEGSPIRLSPGEVAAKLRLPEDRWVSTVPYAQAEHPVAPSVF